MMSQFKFKDLKIFSSTEWLANNEKNYRLVYDESELSYIYCELSFFNKLFDEADWDIKIRLKCIGPNGKEICNLKCDRTVKKEDNIVFIREGWGVKTKGSYWKRGSYRWEAWVDGKYVAEKAFYIEKEGVSTFEENPYFELSDIRLYEGPDANVPEDERRYLKALSGAETRYVWVEFSAENKIRTYDYWACELTFNFKTFSGQLKGSVDKLLFVYPGDDEIHCTIGWGSDLKGSWSNDFYTVEVVFMNHIIASLQFEIGLNEAEMEPEDRLFFIPGRNSISGTQQFPGNLNDSGLPKLMEELDAMIGLQSIKKKIREYTSYLNFIQIRRKKGFEDAERINLHAVFTGNPGTGKTTVAKMLGQIYYHMGLLSKGHVYEVDRTELVAEYIGQTAPKTKEAIKKAKGGILFVDEAYALARKDDDTKDFGKEVIEVLIREMSDGDGDIAIIVAGYPEQMKNFLESNPGLKSRFHIQFEFPDYLPQELDLIAGFAADKRLISLHPEARTYLYRRLVESYRNRSETFGNARYVFTLMEEAKINMGLRVMKQPDPESLSAEELSTIIVEDLEKIFTSEKLVKADIPVDEELLKDSLAQLHHMVGLEKVKENIGQLVKLVRFYREEGKEFWHGLTLHAVFTGNPGTGKTTVARILAQIYRALGILDRGHLVECDRQALVGGYVGQTAIKTKDMLDKAMGGVLFIDEAYALSGNDNDFGKEAVETILKRMEDDRGKFMVIVAGYTNPMTHFLESNPGLKSRFDRYLLFEDYTETELWDIALKQLNDNNVQIEESAESHLKLSLRKVYMQRDKYFGNGRTIRKMVDECIRNQNLRLAALTSAERTPEMIRTLLIEDVKHLDTGAQEPGQGIGFRISS